MEAATGSRRRKKGVRNCDNRHGAIQLVAMIGDDDHRILDTLDVVSAANPYVAQAQDPGRRKDRVKGVAH